jgi:hypothetical protein
LLSQLARSFIGFLLNLLLLCLEPLFKDTLDLLSSLPPGGFQALLEITLHIFLVFTFSHKLIFEGIDLRLQLFHDPGAGIGLQVLGREGTLLVADGAHE